MLSRVTLVQKLASVSIFELRVCMLTVSDDQLAYKHRGLLYRVHPWTQSISATDDWFRSVIRLTRIIQKV